MNARINVVCFIIVDVLFSFIKFIIMTQTIAI